MIGRLSGFIARHPKTILLIASLLLIPAIIGFVTTRINYDILTYLPKNLNSVQGEQILDKTFNDAAIAIITVEDFEPYETKKMENDISAIEGVEKVLWVGSVVDTSIPTQILPDVLRESLYSADGSDTLMIVRFREEGASETTMKAIGQIRKVMTKNCFISGLSVIGVDIKDLVESEAPIYSVIAVAFALAVLFFTMESYSLPVIVLVSLGYAVLYNMGTNFSFGSISYITESIAAILQLGITMDYSVFLIDRFAEEKKKCADKTEAMAKAIGGTFLSISGSSLTTAFGFLALCFMSFTLGLDIGLVMTKGVVFGILTVVTVLPSFILIFDNLISRTSHRDLKPKFSGLNRMLIKHKKILTLFFVLLFIPAFYMSHNVTLYYNMVKAMPADSDAVVALNKMKTEFNMATTHFIIVRDDMSAADMADMTEEIENVDGITNVVGVGSFVGGLVPISILPDAIKNFAVKDGYQILIANTNYESSSDEENAQINELKEIVLKYDRNAYLTGEGVLTKDLIEVTSRDFRVTNIISIAAIFILIAIIFKSLSIPFILVAAIELAIMINESFSFAMGTELIFVAPTIIGCVQLGATVDYAILLSSRFKEELTKTQDRAAAMQSAADGACQSILQSSLVFFAATFGVWMISDMDIVKSICALLARGALVSGVVIICFLTPVLLMCEKAISKTSLGWPTGKKKKKTPDITKGDLLNE
ncbi:MAG: MMPL family transporter [Clostridia bacterium]|nr:MMPL family transporter [Clostridia bacterium]